MVVSLQTIAEKCGVSSMTVSRALDPEKRKLLRPKTLEKVMAAIEKYGYVANDSARRLKTGKFDTISLVIGPRSLYKNGLAQFDAFTDIRRWSMLQQVLKEAHSQRFDVKVEASMIFGDSAEIIKNLSNTFTDGVIFDNASEMKPVIDYVVQKQIPCIVMRHDFADKLPGCPAQLLDRRPGLLAAFEHIKKMGHRKIGFIGIQNMQSSQLIHRILQEFLEPLGLYRNDLCRYVRDSIELRHLLDEWGKDLPCTAIFCGNDCLADFLVSELKYRGIQVPENVAVIGYDGLPYLSHLSSVRVPCEEMAAQSVRTLLQWIRQPDFVPENHFETVFINKKTT